VDAREGIKSLSRQAYIGSVPMRTTMKKTEKLEAELDFPNLKLSISSTEPTKGLREITRILHSLHQIDFKGFADDEVSWKLGYLSEELRENKQGMDFIKHALRVEEGVRHKKVSMENKKIIDLESKKYSSALELHTVKTKLFKLTTGMERSNFALVHVSGGIADEEKHTIVDQVRAQLPQSEVQSVFTNQELMGKTVVEGIFFGSFPEEY